jgi:hypothetical protein
VADGDWSDGLGWPEGIPPDGTQPEPAWGSAEGLSEDEYEPDSFLTDGEEEGEEGEEGGSEGGSQGPAGEGEDASQQHSVDYSAEAAGEDEEEEEEESDSGTSSDEESSSSSSSSSGSGNDDDDMEVD